MAGEVTLVGEIGGTNSRFALAENGMVRADTIRRLPNDNYSTFEAACASFQEAIGPRQRIDRAVFAVAGPMNGAITRLTNRNWEISTDRIAGVDASAAWLLNDLQAQGHALSGLGPSAFRIVRKGTERPGAHLVVGIGTGFNVSLVHAAGARVIATAAEAGHLDLPRLPSVFDQMLDGFSVEGVLSGRGVAALTALLCPTADDPSGPEISAALATDTPGQLQRVGALFAAVLGRVIANLALMTLPVSGVTFCGSVSRALIPALHR